MSNQLNVSVLVAARDEYTDQLKRNLQPLIQEGFISIYEDAEIEDESNPLLQFQKFLKQIPKWNQSILDQETNRIKERCPFLMDLVTAIFVSHVKILASVRLGGKHSNIKIKIPTPEIFIHSVYVSAAECLYYNPEPFEDQLDRENTEKIKDIIENSIDDTISNMIPIQRILQEYLCNTFTDHVKQPLNEKIEEDSMPGDILSGNDIMSPSNPIDDGGYESEKSDLSDLFTPNGESSSKEFTDNDPIFPIGDSAPFADKITDDFSLNDNDNDYESLNEVKEIPVDSKGMDFLSSITDEPVSEVKESSDDIGLGDLLNTESSNSDDLDFKDSIPLNQDTSSFNDLGSSSDPIESDFNFFDNNDLL